VFNMHNYTTDTYTRAYKLALYQLQGLIKTTGLSILPNPGEEKVWRCHLTW